MDSGINVIVSVALRFMLLSLFAIGGGVMGMLPQLHAEYVTHGHLIDERTFSQLLAVAQATPGPNFLIVTLIGWRLAGWAGAFATLFAFLLFPTLIALTVGRAMRRYTATWLTRVRRSLQPMTAALWLATGVVITIATDHSIAAFAITGVVTVAALVFDINPLWLCLGAGVVGAVFAV